MTAQRNVPQFCMGSICGENCSPTGANDACTGIAESNRHATLTQGGWLNARPVFQTMAQHWSDVSHVPIKHET